MTALSHPTLPRFTASNPTPGEGPSQTLSADRDVRGDSLARFLGYFSIGLGLAELLAPRTMSRLTGVCAEGLIQFYGLREIVCGVGILADSRPTGWMWARVAGDALDLATLSGPVGDPDRRGPAACAAASVAGVTALDVLCASQLSAAAA